MATRKMRTYEVLENLQEKDVAALWIGRFLTVLIVVSVLGVIFDTVKSLHAAYASTFYAVEAFCVAVFSVEYILRVWCCTVHPAYRHPVWGRLRYMCTPMMLIDLVSILPFFLPFLLHDLGFVRVLRLFRLFRLLKLVRYSESLLSLRNVLVDRREDLGITFVTEIFFTPHSFLRPRAPPVGSLTSRLPTRRWQLHDNRQSPPPTAPTLPLTLQHHLRSQANTEHLQPGIKPPLPPHPPYLHSHHKQIPTPTKTRQHRTRRSLATEQTHTQSTASPPAHNNQGRCMRGVDIGMSWGLMVKA